MTISPLEFRERVLKIRYALEVSGNEDLLEYLVITEQKADAACMCMGVWCDIGGELASMLVPSMCNLSGTRK